jgi:hypothetical protein
VAVALEGRKWMCGLQRMDTEVALRQFVDLWQQLSQIQLTQENDIIKWSFTSSAQYTAKSAYQLQFRGAMAETSWDAIWKAKVETKCKIFLWLLLQC